MTKPTVLIIEDDPSLRRVLEFSLEESGYRVLTAESGEEGLDLFRNEGPSLVITDIAMPGISGYEVLKAVKEESPDTVVIVITAFGSVEKAVEAMKLGAYDYLTKPFGRDELRLVVAKALDFSGLQAENARLREVLNDRVDFSHIVGISPRMQQVFEVVRRVAATEATVLLLGESGTGKELVARAIHHGSDRSQGSFVAVNCAAIPRDLLESTLFGHRKGSFTGAVSDRAGKFEQARGGTLFLDEVGELPIDLQPKLLRVLQEREIEPVGAEPVKVDVRVIAATNRQLRQAVDQGSFREDLYYRLAVIPVTLPALRERRDDIPLLVRHFVRKHAGQAVRVDEGLLQKLSALPWAGNVRELENCVERMLILRHKDHLTIEDFAPMEQAPSSDRDGGQSTPLLNIPEEGVALEEIEKQAIVEALHRHGGNQTRAAAFLRIPRHTLIYRMEKYDIKRQYFR